MSSIVSRLVTRLVSQDRAVANARTAAVELCRRRVERREVEIYLEERSVKVSRTA
jgi:hypothetical protein